MREKSRSFTRKKSRSLMRETAERDGYPEREAVPAITGDQAGEFAHPAQPVAHGVRMHEEQPGGRLQRVALLQVGHGGGEQHGPPPHQRLLHPPPEPRPPPLGPPLRPLPPPHARPARAPGGPPARPP